MQHNSHFISYCWQLGFICRMLLRTDMRKHELFKVILNAQFVHRNNILLYYSNKLRSICSLKCLQLMPACIGVCFFLFFLSELPLHSTEFGTNLKQECQKAPGSLICHICSNSIWVTLASDCSVLLTICNAMRAEFVLAVSGGCWASAWTSG